jgi:hypothetical protein
MLTARRRSVAHVATKHANRVAIVSSLTPKLTCKRVEYERWAKPGAIRRSLGRVSDR